MGRFLYGTHHIPKNTGYEILMQNSSWKPFQSLWSKQILNLLLKIWIFFLAIWEHQSGPQTSLSWGKGSWISRPWTSPSTSIAAGESSRDGGARTDLTRGQGLSLPALGAGFTMNLLLLALPKLHYSPQPLWCPDNHISPWSYSMYRQLFQRNTSLGSQMMWF